MADFKKSSTTSPLLFLENTAPASLGGKYGMAFLPAGPASATLTLAQAWETPGVFLFLNAAQSAIQSDDVAQRVGRLLDDPAWRDTRVLWIANPADPLPRWQMSGLPVKKQSGKTSGELSQTTFFDFRNLSLGLARGSAVTLTGNEIVIPSSNGFFLSLAGIAKRLRNIGDEIRLPLEGDLAGCLQFDLTLDLPQAGRPYEDLFNLDAGFRVFYKDLNLPSTDADYFARSVSYSFLTEEPLRSQQGQPLPLPYAKPLTLATSLDPLNPLNGTRTFFSFFKDGVTADNLPSCFRSTMGRMAMLKPVDGNSRLVLAVKPSTSKQNSNDPYYLVPAGDFEVTVKNMDGSAPAQPDLNLLCGLSGVEFVKLTPSTTRMSFEPGRHAFAEGFISSPILSGLVTSPPQPVINGVKPPLPPALPAVEGVKVTATHKETGAIRIANSNSNGVYTLTLTPGTHELLFEKAGFKKHFFDNFHAPAGDLLTKNVRMEAGQPAQVVGSTSENPSPGSKTVNPPTATLPESNADLLSAGATTSWVYLKENGAFTPIYYAQPDQAVFHQPFAAAAAVAGDLLEAMEIPSVPLADDSAPVPAGSPPRAFPMLPYGGVDGKNLEDYRQLELNRLSPMRRQRIHDIYAEFRKSQSEIPLLAPGTTLSAEPTGVTPQGLLATFSKDFETWKKLTLAKDKPGQKLELTELTRGAPLRDALQSNKLFLVISNPEHVDPFMKDAGNTLTIAGWGFNFDPLNWATHGTILIFKSYDKALQELIDLPALWTLSDVFNRSNRDETRAKLSRLVREAVAKGGSGGSAEEREKYGPLAEAATNPGWAGILALNLTTPLDKLPSGLEALAGGINKEKFFAQYFGIETSPVDVNGAVLEPRPSSLFALIDYKDDAEPTPSDSGYNFQVTKLTAVFDNSHLKSFGSEISVTLDKLFGERTDLIATDNQRNIIKMTGTVEKHNGVDTYSFGFSGKNRFALPDSAAIEEVEIIKASFTTDPVDQSATDPTITGRFSFWGNLNFRAWPASETTDLKITQTDHQPGADTVRIGPGAQDLQEKDLFVVVGDPQPYKVSKFENGVIAYTPQSKTGFPFDATLRRVDPDKAFDALSFGPSNDPKDAGSPAKGLRFSNLVVQMNFLQSKPEERTFVFDLGKLSFDLKKTGVRAQSLYAKFPLILKELVVGKADKTPASLGFQPVKTPLGGTAPAGDWYGFIFDLDLGTAGELAGKAGLLVSILTAWTPGDNQKGVYVGLRLPGSSGGKKEMSLQGILKLAFKSIRFVVNSNESRDRFDYILKLKNIQLKFMVLSLPPKAQTEIIIFGNTDGTVEDRSLGWFAAYEGPPRKP